MAGDQAHLGTELPAGEREVDKLPAIGIPKRKPNKVYPLKQHPSWNSGPDINFKPPTHEGRWPPDYMIAQRVSDGKVRNE